MFYRSTVLSSSHYAGKWVVPDESQRYDLAVINQIGYNYAVVPDSPEKEALLLRLLECFHGYLNKYLIMILRGTIPQANSTSGREAKEFLRLFIPKGTQATGEQISEACKSLHLAFKGETSEEIYNTLAFCLMRAARRYDPYYTDKTKKACEAIDGKEFTAEELAARVGFDCIGILRSLVRKDFLSSVIGRRRKVVAYRTAAKWPPPAGFFEVGPIGFVYMLQIWFRYYLREHIIEQLSEVESEQGMLQMLHAKDMFASQIGDNNNRYGGYGEFLAPHLDGNCTVDSGSFRFMADKTLMDLPLDVSTLTMDWVGETSDKLFRDLTRNQRLMLYLHFFEEQPMKQIGKTLGISEFTARKRFEEVLEKVRFTADLP